MSVRRSRSFRASEWEMGQIRRAALIVGLGPATLVRKAALATARRILEAGASNPRIAWAEEVASTGSEGTDDA